MSVDPQSWCPCSLEAERKVKSQSMLEKASCLEFPVFSFLEVDFCLKQRFSTGFDFPSPCDASQKILAMSGMFLVVTAEAGEVVGL